MEKDKFFINSAPKYLPEFDDKFWDYEELLEDLDTIPGCIPDWVDEVNDF